jgi:hypothetical protein
MNILDFLFWFPVDGCAVERNKSYVLVFNGCNWTMTPMGIITGEQYLTMDCDTYNLCISWDSGNCVDLSCLLYVPPTCYPVPLSLDGYTLYTNQWTDCESSIDISSILPAMQDLQGVCNIWHTTSTDIEVTDLAKGIVLKSTDGTRHRLTLVDDGLGNYNIDISATL